MSNIRWAVCLLLVTGACAEKEEPDTEKSDTEKSDTEKSDTEKSDTEKSDTGTSDTGTSDTGTSDTGMSVTGEPEGVCFWTPQIEVPRADYDATQDDAELSADECRALCEDVMDESQATGGAPECIVQELGATVVKMSCEWEIGCE